MLHCSVLRSLLNKKLHANDINNTIIVTCFSLILHYQSYQYHFIAFCRSTGSSLESNQEGP